MDKKILDRQSILESTLRFKNVEVPGLDGVIRIKEADAVTAAKVAKLSKNKNLGMEMRHAFWFVYCVVDENGDTMFDEEDVAWLVTKSWGLIQTVVHEILAFSGLLSPDAGAVSEGEQEDGESKNE